MPILHTVNRSPFERNALEACLRVAKPGAGVLLIEDGVYAVVQGTAIADAVCTGMKTLSFYALGPDLKARGYDQDQVIDGVDIVDYRGFVDLVIKHDSVLAWL